MMPTEAQLVACLPRVPALAVWHAALTEAMERFQITTPARCAAFLAQVGHESNDCRTLVEDLSYSAGRLAAVWPKRFPTIASAEPYARQPEKLANLVYSRRLGNGDVASGDGWRFRGRGLLQVTGRSNYRAAGAALGIDLETHPEQLEEPLPAALAAANFFASRGCNELADADREDDDDEDFVRITMLINGGRIGLDDRRARWARAKAALVSPMSNVNSQLSAAQL
jgi:putative chitinase